MGKASKGYESMVDLGGSMGLLRECSGKMVWKKEQAHETYRETRGCSIGLWALFGRSVRNDEGAVLSLKIAVGSYILISPLVKTGDDVAERALRCRSNSSRSRRSDSRSSATCRSMAESSEHGKTIKSATIKELCACKIPT